MRNLEIPTDFTGITPDWLTKALCSTGVISKASVSSLEYKLIGEGKGFAGQIALFTLSYDSQKAGAPSALVCKLPPPVLFSKPEPNMVRGVSQIYANEIRFYREMSEQIPLSTPRFYYGNIDMETGHAVLLIEHIADAHVGDILVGPTADQTRLAIETLAAFHAAFWGSSQLANFGWVISMDGAPEEAVELYGKRWQQYIDRHAAYCPPVIMDIGTRLQTNLPHILLRLKAAPQTFLHGDYHLYNMLFRKANSDLLIIDWQRPQKGPGLWDFAYFMSICVGVEIRRHSELPLLESYYSLLIENGVSDYSFAQCKDDYRLALARVWMTLVIDIGNVDFSNPHAQAIRDVVFPRRNAILIDNDIRGLLE